MQAPRTAATGMAAQQLNVEVISNNIANMNTIAFKRQRAEFQDLLYQTFEAAGVQSSDQGTIVPTGVQVGAGVKSGAVYRIGTQGSLTRTDNQYDLAIDGRGNLYRETAASGAPTTGTPGSTGIGRLVQGYTEASNVDAVAEITALIVAQRAYEMNSKVISTADNMLATANQVKA